MLTQHMHLMETPDGYAEDSGDVFRSRVFETAKKLDIPVMTNTVWGIRIASVMFYRKREAREVVNALVKEGYLTMSVDVKLSVVALELKP